MKRHFFVLAAVIFSNQLKAQEDTTLLNEVVITTNKYPKKQSETGKVVTTITREQLERSGGNGQHPRRFGRKRIDIAGWYSGK